MLVQVVGLWRLIRTATRQHTWPKRSLTLVSSYDLRGISLHFVHPVIDQDQAKRRSQPAPRGNALANDHTTRSLASPAACLREGCAAKRGGRVPSCRGRPIKSMVPS